MKATEAQGSHQTAHLRFAGLRDAAALAELYRQAWPDEYVSSEHVVAWLEQSAQRG